MWLALDCLTSTITTAALPFCDDRNANSNKCAVARSNAVIRAYSPGPKPRSDFAAGFWSEETAYRRRIEKFFMTSRQSSALARPTGFPWPPLLIAFCVLGALSLGYLYPLPWPGMNDWSARIIGLGFGVVGLALLIWAIVTMHRARTNILPHKAADKLVTHGPFARFRNPIYLGDALLFLGLAELTQNIWFVIFAAAFVPLITWLAIIPEERHLEAKFGDDYRAYKKRSRRWL